VTDHLRWLCRGEHALTPSQIPAGWTFDGPIVPRQPIDVAGFYESQEAFTDALDAAIKAARE
jgi:hypothetical protein